MGGGFGLSLSLSLSFAFAFAFFAFAFGRGLAFRIGRCFAFAFRFGLGGIGGRVVGFIFGGELGVDLFQVVEELLFQGGRFLGLGRREIFGFGEIALQVVEVDVAGFPPVVELEGRRR